MTTRLQIPLPTGSHSAPAFPNRCANCGQPRETESRLLLKRLVMRGQRQVEVDWKAEVPHCGRCARATKSVFLAGCVPFALGFIVVGLAAFAGGAYLATVLRLDESADLETPAALVLGAVAGLFLGLIGAFVFELAARIVLLPLMGPALLRAPLLAAQLISDSDYVAGLTARFTKDAGGVQLAFANDAIAREFAALNPGARAGV